MVYSNCKLNLLKIYLYPKLTRLKIILLLIFKKLNKKEIEVMRKYTSCVQF